MRKPSKIMTPVLAPVVKDPMDDDHWETAEDQIDALKDLVADLRANQKKPRKKKTDA